MPSSFRRFASSTLRLPAIGLGIFLAAGAAFFWTVIRMPGSSFSGPVSAFSDDEEALAATLERDVTHLAVSIGERNLQRPGSLDATVRWLEADLAAAGLAAQRRSYEVSGQQVHNVEVVVRAQTPKSRAVVVGAHYDSAIGTPGANDNGSGVAVLLELARRFAGASSPLELRLVWFTNEEAPYFQTPDMGSLRYARALAAEGCKVSAMLSLETMGFYVDGEGTQQYPGPLRGLFPSEGNFVAFVGNSESRGLVREAVGAFRRDTAFPSEGVAFSGDVQGIGWSDHWSFWQAGYPALMVTDTALFRYAHYHKPTDTPDRIIFPRLARVTVGVAQVVRSLLHAR